MKVKAAGFCETLVPSNKLRDMPFQNTALLVFVSVRAGHLAVFMSVISGVSRSRWPRGLRRGSAAARLLGVRVRIPPGVWMCRECCVLSVEVSATGRSLVQRSPTECGVSERDPGTS